MKKSLMIVLAVFMGVSLATTVFAQTAKEKDTKADTGKAATKAEILQYTGEVITMEELGKAVTLIVKGKEGERTFYVTDADMKVPPQAGVKVMVKYMERHGKMVAKSVVVVKDATKSSKKEAKPAETPAPAPAPEKK